MTDYLDRDAYQDEAEQHVTGMRTRALGEFMATAHAIAAAARHIERLEYELAHERSSRRWYEDRFHEHCKQIQETSGLMVATALAVIGRDVKAAQSEPVLDTPEPGEEH